MEYESRISPVLGHLLWLAGDTPTRVIGPPGLISWPLVDSHSQVALRRKIQISSLF